MNRIRSIVTAGVAMIAGWIASGSDVLAQTQEIRGRACIISASAQCAAKGWKVGDCATARYSPANALGWGNRTRLSLFFGEYAQNFQQEGSAVGLTYRPVKFSWVGGGGGNAAQSLSQWRIPLMQPADLSWPFVHMLVDIWRYEDFGPDEPSFCAVRFRITGQKRPEIAAASGTTEALLPTPEFGTPSVK